MRVWDPICEMFRFCSCQTPAMRLRRMHPFAHSHPRECMWWDEAHPWE